MKRNFLKSLLAFSLSTIAFSSFAQGKQSQAMYSVETSSVKAMIPNESKPTLVELFWYGCPHCFTMKPMVESLAAQYAGKINFVRFPVGFKSWESGTRLFFTLEQYKVLDKAHNLLFNEIHVNKRPILNDIKARATFFKQIGLDPVQAEATMNSFSVSNKTTMASKFIEDMKVNSSPILAVYYNGKFHLTSPVHTGSYQNTIAVANQLLTTATKVKTF